MGTEELKKLRCGTCDNHTMRDDGQMHCKLFYVPRTKDDLSCISHSKAQEAVMKQ